MSNLLNVGVRALMANQVALQTAGTNISNVNTPGYSRQTVVLANLPGQFSGSGYYGQGVNVSTITRNYSQFLTRQSALANSQASADTSRLEKLTQLEDIFQGGSTGLGASISDMLNAFSDVANAPTDLTARTVVLTRANETAARFRTAASSLDSLQIGALSDITQGVDAINSLAKQIGAVNGEIAKATGTGHEPNDLLDQRDQLVAELNKLVQTSSIKADDGTVGIFLAGSQALVLGTAVASLKVAPDAVNDPQGVQLAIVRNGLTINLNENTLGGGKLTGLMRFNNTDLAEARNLLGRIAVSVSTVANAQHRLGIDLNGAAGGDLFSPPTLPNGLAGIANTGNATIGVTVADTSALIASQYEVQFTAPGVGSVVRLSDGTATAFASTPITVDGLVFTVTAGAEAAGDVFRMKPFATSARDINVAFSSPKALAIASPVEALPSTANKGGLSIVTVQAKSANANLTQTVTLTFNAGGTFDVVGTGTGDPTGVTYTSGLPIAYNGWELTLKGAPQPGDVYTVQVATPAYTNRNAGNADAMMALRDVALFDGAALTDGFAGLMAKVGTTVQSVTLAAGVSASIATNVDKDRAGMSGVNLDEEAARLLQFQQAYQGTAKLIQIAESIFNTLIQSLG
jgi:flagellar hook-associated protein 1